MVAAGFPHHRQTPRMGGSRHAAVQVTSRRACLDGCLLWCLARPRRRLRWTSLVILYLQGIKGWVINI